ncbi:MULTISPECIES: CoA ester lyase [Allobacillus]|uniref:CoA ester lyase n=1 Tax=Allobacillus salarius TaxID=1955272 RepID=A0A556PML5_9BACI|nr:CoA ester lyase [Allobacillus salarius]TSJ65645.1 CoA ester lyase [Allobacillus salarius]
MSKQKFVLRSMLYVPAYNKKFIDSALNSKADAIIIDLEDSVPDMYKQEARQITKEYLGKGLFKDKTLFIRLNPIESKMVFEDLKYVFHSDVTGFQLSKIYSSEDMIYYDKLFTQFESEHGFEEGKFKFVPLIETTAAVMDIFNIAKVSERTIALCFGGEDFLHDLSGLHGEPPKAFDYPRAAIALAARGAGILPIDTPYLSLDDTKGFMEEESKSFEMGYAGCLLIHPKQIEVANACFTPKKEEVERSKRIVTAIKDAKERGSGVAMLDGKMIGPPMRKRAEQVIEIMNVLESKGLV